MNTTNKKLRLFVGIPLAAKDKDILKFWVSQLKSQITSKHVHWVTPENYHLTIEFLGMVEAEKINAIIHTLQEIQHEFTSFSLELDGWLFFPNPTRPKIICIYVHLNEMLGKLYAIIHQKMSALDFVLDQRPYVPHVTIARCKNIDLHHTILEQPTHPLSIEVNQVTLFESVQIDNQVTYIIKYNCNFS